MGSLTYSYLVEIVKTSNAHDIKSIGTKGQEKLLGMMIKRKKKTNRESRERERQKFYRPEAFPKSQQLLKSCFSYARNRCTMYIRGYADSITNGLYH